MWINVKDELPPEGIPVMTKISDGKGTRNECELRRSGNLWFFMDDSLYVYYTPTHWKHINPVLKFAAALKK